MTLLHLRNSTSLWCQISVKTTLNEACNLLREKIINYPRFKTTRPFLSTHTFDTKQTTAPYISPHFLLLYPPATLLHSVSSSCSQFHQHPVLIYLEDFVNKQVYLPVLLLYAANHTLYHSTENTPTTLQPQSQSILQDLLDYEIDSTPGLL